MQRSRSHETPGPIVPWLNNIAGEVADRCPVALQAIVAFSCLPAGSRACEECASRGLALASQTRAGEAHILVCFLAYVLWKAPAQWMRASGLGDAPRTLLEDLAKIKSGDVVLPARGTDGQARTIRLRCVTTPDEAQKVLLERLGLRLPQCLRLDEVAQM